MNIKELIEELQQYPDDMEIMVQIDRKGECYYVEDEYEFLKSWDICMDEKRNVVLIK